MEKLPNNEFVQFKDLGGILYCRFKAGRTLNLAAAEKIVRDRIIWQNGIAYPILCDIRAVRNADMQTRDFFIDQGSHLIIALTFLISNDLNYSMFKYYASSLKIEIPIKVYYDKEEAMASLSEYLRTGTPPNPTP